MSKRVSVIMPVYNVEKYLNRAMESAINQSFDNYEIICVDDGSKDSSVAILDYYARDEKVKVIHKENTGYGNSMNVGISASTGDYIFILEPDDYIEKDTLKKIMEVIAKEGEIDIVKCNFSFVKGEESEEIIPTRVLKDISLYGRILSGEDILSLYSGYIAHWTAVYRRKFLDENHIRYNETPGASFQDIGMWFQTTMFAKRVYLLDQYVYFYRTDNPGSSVNNPEKVFCVCDEYDFVESRIVNGLRTMILPYYIKCRIIAVKDNYRRIGREYRKVFLQRAENDFKRIKRQGMLDVSKLDDNDQALLSKLMDSHEKLWQEKEEECQKFAEYIEEIESFYIYGAGNLAAFIYRLLSESEKNKLKGFIVTTNNGEKFIEDKPVEVFGKVKPKIGNSLIVIGVSKMYEGEIINQLEQNDIRNVYVFRGGIV